MLEIGVKIKEIRKKMNCTQEDFAKMLKIDSNSAVSNWELGKRKPDYDTVVNIALIGRVSLDWLLTGEEYNDQTESEINEKTLEGQDVYKVVGLPLEEQLQLLREKCVGISQELESLKAQLIEFEKGCPHKDACKIKELSLTNNNNV